MTPLTHPGKNIDHVDSEIKDTDMDFKKESSQVPRMMPLIHSANNLDFLVLHIQVLYLIKPDQGQNTSAWA